MNGSLVFQTMQIVTEIKVTQMGILRFINFSTNASPQRNKYMKEKIDYKILLNPEVEAAMQGFVPRFCNSRNIEIVKDYTDLKYRLTLAHGNQERKKQLMAIDEEMKQWVKDLKSKEKSLLGCIQNR